jgi:predicted RNA polymerase sigma factor
VQHRYADSLFRALTTLPRRPCGTPRLQTGLRRADRRIRPAWITVVAQRELIEYVRPDHAWRDKEDGLARESEAARRHGNGAVDTAETSTTDDRLRLIFTYCHPALNPQAEVALICAPWAFSC